MPQCSIIIPIYNRASLTQQCLNALLANSPENVPFEIIVIDDASIDMSPQLLANYGDQIRVVTQVANTGFAAACNEGATVAAGQYLVFLNNDTLPQAGWLDALVRYADSHPGAAAVGSKLLFANDTVQHAGVVICQDRYPRHLYTGFPADHPAVNKSRRFQIVTAACMLIRREAFEQVGGFDTAFRNGFEDVDLCLRLGEHGHEIHYCHESVLYHLESASEGRFDDARDNAQLYLSRWGHRVRPDDVNYYLEDGLLSLSYARTYPAQMAISPLLATVERDEQEGQASRLLNMRSRQVFDLLKETTRLSLRIGELELYAADVEQAERQRRQEFGAEKERIQQEVAQLRQRIRELAEEKETAEREVTRLRRTIEQQSKYLDALEVLAQWVEHVSGGDNDLRATLVSAHNQILRRLDEIQVGLAKVWPQNGQPAGAMAVPQVIPDSHSATAAAVPVVTPGWHGSLPDKQVQYRRLVDRIQEIVRTVVPSGATVIVVSKGDDELLKLDGRHGWHFPRGENGVYAGYHPADSLTAINHLESLRDSGGDFLLLPRTAFWWLEHYGDFGRHLDVGYQRVWSNEDCIIYQLSPPQSSGQAKIAGSTGFGTVSV